MASELGQDSQHRKVFVVFGRNRPARDAVFTFLRSLGLTPLEWQQAIEARGSPSPYIGEILDAGFSLATAILVLLTPDDEARLSPDLVGPQDTVERTFRGQPRQNVLFEAGMAWMRDHNRTVLVQIGDLRPMSDISGIHVVHLDNSPEKRYELAKRLGLAGCDVDLSGSDWMRAGDFPSPSARSTETAVDVQTAVAALARDAPLHAESQLPRAVERLDPPNAAAAAETVVDVQGGGQHRSIARAVASATAGQTIRLMPGTYNGVVVIDKDVTIEGVGDRETIVIQADERPALINKGQLCRLINLCLENTGAFHAVISEGGTLEISNCKITSRGRNGVDVSSGIIRIAGSLVENCGGHGVSVGASEASGNIENCTIASCKSAGLDVYNGWVEVYDSVITNNQVGVWVREHGGGKFEDTDLRGNEQGAWRLHWASEERVTRIRNRE